MTDADLAATAVHEAWPVVLHVALGGEPGAVSVVPSERHLGVALIDPAPYPAGLY
jgi:hypothetical protein